MNDTAKSVIRKPQKIKAWEKLLGFFVKEDIRTMCFAIEVMVTNKMLTREEADYMEFEIWTQIPMGSIFMFPTDEKRPRIEFINKQINLLKDKK